MNVCCLCVLLLPTFLNFPTEGIDKAISYLSRKGGLCSIIIHVHDSQLTFNYVSGRKKKSLDETNSYSTRPRLFTLKEINKTTTVGLQCLLHECITQNMFWVVCSRAYCKIIYFVCTQAGEGEGGAKILQINWNIVVCNSLHLYFY